jgi:hypothetical protein
MVIAELVIAFVACEEPQANWDGRCIEELARERQQEARHP